MCTPGTNHSMPCCDDQCQYRPTSYSCGPISAINGHQLKYCANGVCTTSACAGYTDLEYCEIANNNRCRQTCLYRGLYCTSGFSFDLSIADGTVCLTSPYSECLSGKCVTTAVSYYWQNTTSECSCDGLQTVNATCIRTQGGVYPDSYCNSTNPSTILVCTPPDSCFPSSTGAADEGAASAPITGTDTTASSSSTGVDADDDVVLGSLSVGSFSWSTGAWSSCSGDCSSGGGNSTRSVICISSADATTDQGDSACDAASRPVDTEECNTGGCAAVTTDDDCTTDGCAGVAVTTAGRSGASSSLTAGAAAGIAVGVAALVALLAGGAVWYRRRRADRKQHSQVMALNFDMPDAAHSNTATTDVGHVRSPQENKYIRDNQE